MNTAMLLASALAGLVGLLIGAVLVGIRGRRMAGELTRQQQQLAAAEAQQQALELRYQESVAQLGATQQALGSAQANEAKLLAEQARLEERHQAQQEKLAWLESSREQLKLEFEQLSARIFEQRSKQLQEQNRTGLDDLLKPFREQIADFRRRVDAIHGEDARQQATLAEQIRGLHTLHQQMHQDARNLTNALKGQVKTQGNWGEMILERILEESGLTRGREYETQVTLTSEDGSRRQPDVVVHLPDNKDVIIDSKMSLVAYERFCSEEDELLRQQALVEHVQSLRTHIRGLSKKSYEQLDGVRTLDFVLLFIPVEAAFLLAMERAPELYQEAYADHIVLVSPTTLLVTLRTINNIWRYEYQNRNAISIADRAGRICDQISLLEESLRQVGDRLSQANDAWETSYRRLSEGRGNLLRQAHQLRDLGARARRNLPSPQDAEDAEDGESGGDLPDKPSA
ncbi:DNA recombination protein RmuC [Alcanivorax quisquiliarum]|uniref:DNA recombination protein RmuC n=1 Tax=Alcanivorax quisquiliarum TaxID=2933565 RepID=A0ABT0E336_9GAMM|nr:DNA recombination protein RmuC [Alcanivorax quisquiliarum]MCK0536228.1 DNA recombination protein RmuC [Alcanivorax quisquiliarum]